MKHKNGNITGIHKQWGCPPEEALPVGLWPVDASANLLQYLHQLSKATSLQSAGTLLIDAIGWRLREPGRRSNKVKLQVGDVQRALDGVKAVEGGSIERDGTARTGGNIDRQQRGRKTSEKKDREEMRRRCRCPDSLIGP